MTVLENIGVLGAGEIGDGVAERLAVEGYHVVLVDTKPEFIERALANIEKRLRERETLQSTFFPEDVQSIVDRIHGTTDSNALTELPVIVECIPEDKEIKHDTLRRLSQICRKDAIFATSISSCTVSELSEGLSFADRLVGMHFFSHPSTNRLIELVETDASSLRSKRIVEQVANMMGGIPIWSQDSAGFVVKRITAAFYAESVRILNEGVANIATIEAATRKTFSVEAGPFGRMNREGLAEASGVFDGLAPHLPGLYAYPERLRAQAASGECWELEGEVEAAKIETVRERLLGLAVLVGTAIAEEGVASPVDVDLGAKYGLGWMSGPFELIHSLGREPSIALATGLAESRGVDLPELLLHTSEKNGTKRPYDQVELKVHEETAHIVIKRPDSGNALDENLVSQIEGALKKAEKNEAVKIIMFSGVGGNLDAGPTREFLLEKLEQNHIDAILALYKKIQGLFTKIASSKKVTIARMRGFTSGGGIELGLACRYIVASSRAYFSFPETGRGVLPGLGGTQRLPRKVGKSIGKYVVMTGEVLTAESAERLGIVDAVLDDDDAIVLLVNNLGNSESLSDSEAVPSDDELEAIALFNPANCSATLAGQMEAKTPTTKCILETLARKAPAALTLINKLIDDGLSLEISKALHFELSALGLILGTKDALTGIQHKGDLPPVFSGE